jgi:hypothetical protein
MRRIFHRMVLLVAVIALLDVPSAWAAVYVYSSSFSSPSTGVVSGWSSDRHRFVSYTTDGGQTFRSWSASSTTDREPLGAVVTSGGADVYAFDDYTDGIRTSADQGLTFQSSPSIFAGDPNTRIQSMGVFGDGRISIAGFRANQAGGAQPAFLMTSNDRGSTWTTVVNGPQYPQPDGGTTYPNSAFNAIDVDPSGVYGWALGAESSKTYYDPYNPTISAPIGLIRKTADMGSTWTTPSPGPQSLLLGLTEVAAGSATQVFATNEGVGFIRSSDGGNNWTRADFQMDTARPSFMTARAMDARGAKVVVAGLGGKIAYTANAFASPLTWTYYNVPSGARLNGVTMLDDNNWIVVGDNETIVRTSNAGLSWTVSSAGPPSVSVVGPPAGFVPGIAPVTVTGIASDVGLGVRSVEVRIRRADGYNWNGFAWQQAEFWVPADKDDPYWSTWSRTIPADPLLEQMITITARATDSAGFSAMSTSVSSGIPIVGSVSLAGGAAVAAQTTVTAQVSASGATHMKWSGDVVGAPAGYVPIQASVPVTLTSGDGNKTVNFEFSKDGSALAARASDSVFLHTGAPNLAITAPSDNFSIAGGAVSITGTSGDAAGVTSVLLRIRRADGKCWDGSAWTSGDIWRGVHTTDGYANWDTNWTPSAVLTAVTLTAKATDSYGLQTLTPMVASAGQASASVMIDGGAPTTTDATVQVSVNAPGATHMRWSGDVVGAPANFVSVQPSVPVTLTPADGSKTITFEFSTNGSTPDTSTSSTILLHTSVPVAAITSPSAGFTLTKFPATIAGTASDAGGSVQSVSLNLRRSDGYSWTGSEWTTQTAWLPVSTGNGYSRWSYAWTPDASTLATNSIVAISARATDTAGLASTSDILTSGLPIRAQASIAGGAPYTASTQVPAQLAYSGATHVRWSVDGTASTEWAPVSQDVTVTLPSGDGTKTVTFEFSADGQNSAFRVDEQIALDMTAPTLGIDAPASGFDYRTPKLVLQWSVADDLSGGERSWITIEQGSRYWNGSGWSVEPVSVEATPGAGLLTYDWLPSPECIASTKPVTVSIRAADALGNTSTLSRVSIDPLDVTTIPLTTKSGGFPYGGTGYVRGTLTWDALPASGTVELWQRPYNRSYYTKVTSSAVTSLGTFSFAVRPALKTYYQVRFAQSAGRMSATSATIWLAPKVYLSTPSAPYRVRHGSMWTSYGYLKPRHLAGSIPVRIYRERYSPTTRTWVSYGYVYAKAYNYSTYTKYVRGMSLPSAGTWRIRAYHYDSAHAPTYSSYRTVQVY